MCIKKIILNFVKQQIETSYFIKFLLNIRFMGAIFIRNFISSLFYIIPLSIAICYLLKQHNDICKMLSGVLISLVATLLFSNSIKQHSLEQKFYKTTSKIKSNIYSCYYNLFEIISYMAAENVIDETLNKELQAIGVIKGTKKLSQIVEENNAILDTIQISKDNLYQIRSQFITFQNYIDESISLIKTIGNDSSIYPFILDLYVIQEKIPQNIDKQFNKDYCNPLTSIFGGINKSLMYNLLKDYSNLLEKIERNNIIKLIKAVPCHNITITMDLSSQLPEETIRLAQQRLDEERKK